MGRRPPTPREQAGPRRSLRLPLALALVVGVGLLGAEPALAAPTWMPTPDLSAPGADADEQQVAIAPDGEAVAVWKRAEGTASIIETASRPPGGDWSPPTPLTAPGRKAEEPEIAIGPAGEAVAVWEAPVGFVKFVEASWRPRGGEWAPATAISAAGHSAIEPQVAIDEEGEAVAVWTRAGENGLFVVEASSSRRGGAWSQSVPLSTSADNNFDPEVAVDPEGEAVAVWTRVLSGSNEIVEGATRPAGGSWPAQPTQLSAPTSLSIEPQVAISPEGEAVAIWATLDAGQHHIIESASRLFAHSWSSPSPVSAPGKSGFEPQIATGPEGEAVAIWEEDDGGATIETSSRPVFGNWPQQTTRLSPVGTNSFAPEIAVPADGHAVAIWERERESQNIVIESASRDAEGLWPQPQGDATLSVPGRVALAPQIAIDPAGEAVAVWDRHDEAENTIVQGAVLDPVPPRLRSVSIPAGGTVGEPLSFSARPTDFSALTIEWGFGDGAAAEGADATHAYSAPGIYEVALRATDAAGNATSSSAQVRIAAAPAAVGPGAGAPTRVRGSRLPAVAAGRAKLRGGSVLVSLRCPPGDSPCRGLAQLREAGASPGGPLGQSRFQIAGGRRRTLAIHLRATALVRLRRSGRGAPRLMLSGEGLRPRVIRLARGSRAAGAGGSR